MVVLLPPSTQPIPGGTAIPTNVLVQRAFNTGDVFHFGWASAAADPGSRTDFSTTLDEGVIKPFPNNILDRRSFYSETNVNLSYTIPHPMVLIWRVQGSGAPVDSSHGTMFGAHAEYDPVTNAYCQFGTEKQAAAALAVYLTPAVIDSWLVSVEMPYLAPLFAAWWFTSFLIEDLCSRAPPLLPTIDLSTLQAGSQTVFQILQAIAWPNLCQCKAGTPAPIPFPSPTQPEPPGWPTQPTFGCSNTDVCTALVAMQKQLSALQQALNSDLELTTLLQRYSLPFAYIPGATHSDIHVSGSLAISRLVGVRVHVRTNVDANQQFLGVPPYVSDLGWLSVLTADGLIDEIRLTRTDQTWFPKLMPLAISLGIGLRDGVRIDVQELQAEP